jgi:DNA-binding NtrC family response regulator
MATGRDLGLQREVGFILLRCRLDSVLDGRPVARLLPVSGTVLVVEDDAALRRTLVLMLRTAGFSVTECGDGDDADAVLARHEHDVVLLDLGLSGKSGQELLADHAHGANHRPAFVVLSGQDDAEVTITAMKHGAYDYLLKPPDLDRLVASLQRAIAIVRAEATSPDSASADRLPAEQRLVGRTAPMREVFKTIGRVAGTRATVLVSGESGTGKELVARAIHAAGDRPDAPYIAVNCAALSGGLLESELFGHVRGAFTGAASDRSGRFAEAGDGTLLLDEIGELDAALQAKLLRVLEQRTFERVGDSRPTPVDARIIAATNRDLPAAVAAGTFRRDLLHRLDVVSIRLPPLRERMEDLPLLVERLLTRVATDLGLATQATDDAVARLMQHDWPGNVRELYNTLQRAALLCGGVITGEVLAALEARPPSAQPGAGGGIRSLDDVERDHIRATLRRFGWHKRRTAEALEISRVTLDRKIRRYELSPDEDA